jgi:poly(3-hydroxyalkanoate) synthetase
MALRRAYEFTFSVYLEPSNERASHRQMVQEAIETAKAILQTCAEELIQEALLTEHIFNRYDREVGQRSYPVGQILAQEEDDYVRATTTSRTTTSV